MIAVVGKIGETDVVEWMAVDNDTMSRHHYEEYKPDVIVKTVMEYGPQMYVLAVAGEDLLEIYRYQESKLVTIT